MASILGGGDATDIMANLNFSPSSAPLRIVKEIQFGLLSPDEIKNMSVCHVQFPDTMVSFFLNCETFKS